MMRKFIILDAICVLSVVLFFYARHVVRGDDVGWQFVLVGLIAAVVGLFFKAPGWRKAISALWVVLFLLPVGILVFMILLVSH